MKENVSAVDRPRERPSLRSGNRGLALLCGQSTESQSRRLSEKAYTLVAERFARLQPGTALGGVPEVGVAIETLLLRQPR